MTPTSEDEPTTAEDLVRELMDAGASERWARLWVTSPTGLLSGLRPSDALVDPATADRARTALRRHIARLPEPIPDGVHVTGARIRDEDTYMLELTFAWPGGTAVRHWDAEPYLAASRVHEVLLVDYPRFAQLHIDNRTLAWPGDLDFAPEFLYGEFLARRHARRQVGPDVLETPAGVSPVRLCKWSWGHKRRPGRGWPARS